MLLTAGFMAEGAILLVLTAWPDQARVPVAVLAWSGLGLLAGLVVTMACLDYWPGD